MSGATVNPGALLAMPALSPSSSELPPGLGAPAPPTDEHGRGGWIALFRNRRYLLYLASSSLASTGYAVYSVSVLFLAYGLSGNLLVAGLVLFIEYGVYSCTFLFAPLVDRARDKRTLLLLVFPPMGAASAALAIALATGHLGVPLLLGIVFVLAVGWDVAWAVFMIAPPIVLAKRELFVAEGLGSVLSVGTATGGYAGGAALLYVVGPAGGATAYALLLVAAALAAVPLTLRVESSPVTGIGETFRAGWRAFRGSAGRALRSVAALEIFLGGFTALPPLLITAIAYREYADPAAVYGLFVTAYALGGSAAGMVAGHYNPRRSIGLVMALGALAAGLCILALLPGGASELAVAALLAGAGAAVTVRFAARTAWSQGSFPPEILGRVISNLYLFTGAASTAAVILVGGLAAGISLTDLELLDGGGLLVGALLTWASPTVRSLAF